MKLSRPSGVPDGKLKRRASDDGVQPLLSGSSGYVQPTSRFPSTSLALIGSTANDGRGHLRKLSP